MAFSVKKIKIDGREYETGNDIESILVDIEGLFLDNVKFIEYTYEEKESPKNKFAVGTTKSIMGNR